MVKATRILLADDHALLRKSLASLLNLQPDLRVVAQAGTGREAIDLHREHRPEIGLIDIEMSGCDGAEAVSLITDFDPTAKLIMLTAHAGEEDISRALRAGAKGYLLKDEDPEVLFTCIRKVAAGGKHIPSRIAEKMANDMTNERLSDREMDVLKLLGQGRSNLRIAQEMGITEGTVKFHMNNLMAKLRVSDRTQAVLVASKRGLFRIT